MIRLIQRRLIIPRGDTGSFSIPVIKNNTDNIAVFTIFDETTKTRMFQKMIQSEGDVINIAFTHSDTVNLKPGKYVWDIKYYSNPEFIDDELVNGEEVDSYYAGFSLPVCEIRETADNYLVSPDTPDAKLSPEQLEIVTGAIRSLNEAIRKTQENVEHYPEIRDEVWYVWDAELGDYVSTGVRANGIVGNGIASAVLNDDYTLTLNFTDGTSFISPSIRGETGNGIDDIVLNNDFTLTISYTDGESYTTPSIRGPVGATPQFSIGTVQDGAVAAASITGTAENPVLNLTLPNANVPTRVSELENDSGYVNNITIGGTGNIVSNGKANIFFGSDENYGVVKSNATKGIEAVQGVLQIKTAESVRIKGGQQPYSPITPYNQHESTFYGLAKVAGDTTQARSNNAAGVYTDEAKAAIQQMLDVPSNADIPTQVSELTNDAGYLTTEIDPTVPAWAKAAQKPSYTAAEVGAPTVAEMNTAIGTAIGQINSFDMAVVQELPIQDISTHTIYLIPKTGETNDVYDEYVYINDNWEMVGNTQIDLSNYATKDELPDVPVQDVQVNGQSVVSDGVANVPVASNSNVGLVRGNNNAGIDATSGVLGIVPAPSANIKAGASYYHPIVPVRQHESTFYGLAKAAGDTTQSASSNAVGQYTDEAKAAIRTMIGAPALEDIPDAPVQDVQVNGVSVLQDGVANVPMGSNNVLGVMKGGSVIYGTTIDDQGRIRTVKAADNEIKGGNGDYKIITSSNQHKSTFYGLAKAAGHDENNSTEPLGTYTPEAKGAIQQMLGVSDLIATAENDLVASKAYAIGDVFTANGKLYKVTTAIAADGAIVLQNEGETVSGANAEECDISNIYIRKDDYAYQSHVGVVKIANQYGIDSNGSNGTLLIKPALTSLIKNPTGTEAGYKPIVPNTIPDAVFYGLAKAAGADEKDSTLPVGQYTDTAKAAIKNMLGITQTLTVTVLTQDNVTVTGQTVTVRADNSEGEIYATAAYEGQPVSFSLPTGFQFYVSVSDTLNHHFNPTTARGVIKDANVAVTLQYSDFSIIRTAPDIKAALNAGMDLTDLVGEQITCTKDSGTLTWDVVDYDATNKSVKLLLHDCFGTANMVFEPAQALMWCENGLAAGAYTFKNSTTSYYFTLTQAIPAGGQLVASDDGTFKTYESQSAMATLETGTVSTTEIAGATDLGTTATGLLNHNSRVRYGSNNYAESALLWWLNTDAPAGTLREPITKFSRAYSYNVPGFLSNLDADFIACLDDVEWLCSTNNTYECPKELGGYTNGIRQAYTITKKIGLASEMEIFGSYDGTSDGSTVFDLYNDAENTDRVKYRGTSAQVWWLRSPAWGSAGSERHVLSSGSANNYSANLSYAVVPACQISKTTE